MIAKKIYPLLSVMILSSLLVIFIGRFDLLFWLCLEILLVYYTSYLFSRWGRLFFWGLYCIALGVQVSSVYSTGNYIIPLTLSNIGEYSAIGWDAVLKIVIIIISFIFLAFLILLTRAIPSRNRWLGLVFMITAIYLGPTPLHMLISSFISYYSQVTYKPNYNYPDIAKSFLKVGIWSDKSNSPSLSIQKPNVIVIFTEGMSSEIIDVVNNRDLNLTPTFDMLYQNSIVFENYYNHTAATFRGLRGQLTSAYQFKDGIGSHQDGFAEISNEKVTSTYSKRLVSLPEILNKHGYKTYFLSSTDRNSTLNSMLKTMSFTKVFGMGDFKFYQEDRMTDKQTFASLKSVLSSQQQQPFFIGVYPSGTHHGRDSPDAKYGDGKNIYYNKFYNYDAELGDFISYFNKSIYAKNTILIITADHSTFPTPEFKQSFGIKANYFVDKIPLIIYGADLSPQKIDAQGYNSLSLTPTILQLLNINNEPNYFLGCSLFDKVCKSQFSTISAIGDSYYETHSDIYSEYNVKEILPNLIIKEFYNVSG